MGIHRIALIATGGTISGVADAREGTAGRGADAIAGGLGEGLELRTVDTARVPSRAMTPELMRVLAQEVRQQVAGGCDGVVITHGTDTLEETAYALALMLDRDAPVALTGSMRLPATPGYDGDANLSAALALAADPRCAALGPVVVIGDEVHAARWVAKVHTSRPAAFGSPGLGPIGAVAEGRVRLALTTVPSDLLGMPASLDRHTVELLWIAAGASGRLVDATAEYADGIVVAGTGGGHVPGAVAAAIGRAISTGVRVVIASRCGAGPLLQDVYAGDGGERHLRSLGAIFAGDLAPLKARLRLHVELALDLPVHEAFS